MSDLFIGEILALSLLVPVLLRPFFRRLQNQEGIAMLPLVSLLLATGIVAGSGLSVTFLPVFLFIVLVFLAGTPRMVRFFSQLPTDWFSPVSFVFNLLLVALFAVVLGVSCIFISEPAYHPNKPVQRAFVKKTVSPGLSAVYTVFSGAGKNRVSSPKGVVLFAGDISSGPESRNTTASILAENGYVAVSGNFTGWQEYGSSFLLFPVLRHFLGLSGFMSGNRWLFTSEAEALQVQKRELVDLSGFARSQYGDSIPLFVVSEGSGVAAFLSVLADNPAFFAGGVCIVSADRKTALPAVSGGSVAVSSSSGMMPTDAGSFPVLFLTAENSRLAGFGELEADDVLGAVLLGGKRDTDRKLAEMTGQRINGWITARSLYETK